MGGTAGAGGAAAAVIAQAIKASGVLVRVTPGDFGAVLARNEEPLAVHAPGGFLNKKHAYLMAYRGLTFHTTSKEELPLPPHVEVVESKKIWIPG
jgi:hypothetical protein